MELENEKYFKDAPVWKSIFVMAVPSVMIILVMILYNLADMFFIAMLNNTAQVAAVSLVGPLFSVMAAVATMVGNGGCTAIAGAIGGGVLFAVGILYAILYSRRMKARNEVPYEITKRL